ncbi:hypothetical protein [Rhodobium gokarnense]|uniref:Uncharacterized protein n=1 Tax=Rhodobium gokarnense TaxID=364296 RepID=A0ABT3HDB7_9HYPH|nr:hypothetical protein [Rhodobium gokarnense]MCW2308375.1 hypothetical protein [Rhodobium gokarnense]
MADREVIRTERSNGPGWFIAGMLVVLIVGAGALYYGGFFDKQEADINLSVEVPDIGQSGN